jgi:hypothetical protein
VLRGAASAVAAILFVGVLALALGADAEDIRETPFTPDGLKGRLITVDLDSEPTGDRDARQRTLNLFAPSLDALAAHPELRLQIATGDTNPRLSRAVLQVAGTGCAYESAPGARLRNNRTLRLLRGADCTHLDAATGEIRLTITLRTPGRVVVWALLPSEPADAGIYLGRARPAQGDVRPLLRGHYVDHLPESNLDRIDLLAYVWQIDLPGGWIWVMLAVAGCLLGAGTWLLFPGGGPRTRLRASVLAGGGGFALAAAFGLAHAVLVPPFQAPDEPNHFLQFANMTGRPDIAPQADAWAEQAHVQRLRFNVEERFRPSDVGQPGEAWIGTSAPDASIRGPAVAMFWRLVSPLAGAQPAPRVLLSLRLANALILAVAVGGVVALIVVASGLPSPHLLLFALLIVPTLPFFGMHVSNHAPLIAAYVVIALGIALIVMDDQADIAGLLVGCGWAAAIALSRSAMPLAPLIVTVAGARLLAGPSGWHVGSSVRFWAGLVVPLLVFVSASEQPYVESSGAVAAAILPAAWQPMIGVLAQSPWLLAFAVPLLVALEWGLWRLRVGAGPTPRAAVRTATRWAAASGAAAVAALMLGSLFVRYPQLARIDRVNRPAAIEYTRDTLRAGLTMFRAGSPDYMTSVTFWGGFGWLETVAEDWFVSVMASATGIALIVLLLHAARRSDTRLAIRLAAAVVGYALSLAAYALSLSQLEVAVDLVGRYVFGLYLSMVVICWGGLALVRERRLVVILSLAGGLACAAVHAYCLRLILVRYF